MDLAEFARNVACPRSLRNTSATGMRVLVSNCTRHIFGISLLSSKATLMTTSATLAGPLELRWASDGVAQNTATASRERQRRNIRFSLPYANGMRLLGRRDRGNV